MRCSTSLLLLAACQVPLEEPEVRPDWARDVGPLVEEHCAGCHAEGRIAAEIPLQTYAQAAPLAARMLEEVQTGRMPPWPAKTTDWCPTPFAFRGDLRLDPDEVALLEEWVAKGLPEGPRELALEPGEEVVLEDVNQVLQTPPFEVEPDGRDDYLCAILDPELTGDGWLEGVAVVPGQPDVVHHADIRIVGADASVDGDLFMCATGVGVSNDFVGTYAPGSGPSEAPPGAAMRVPAGSKVLVTVHYHPLADRAVTDSTEVHLRWADQPQQEAVLSKYPSPPDLTMRDLLEPGPYDRGQPEVYIPAGVSGHVETLAGVLPGDPSERFEIWQIASHMHLAGVEGRIWVEHPDGSTECLLHVPAWDFDWQRMYRYLPGTGPVVAGGTKVVSQCVYDNTLENPALAASLAERGLDAPIDIEYGPETWDEMCMFMVGTVPADGR